MNNGVVVLNPTRTILQDEDGYQVDIVKDTFNETRLKVSTTSRGKPEYDSFGRFRVSNPYIIFDSKQDFDSDSNSFNIATNNDGYVSYIQEQAKSSLYVLGSSTDSVIRQSKRYLNYQPGRSNLLFMSFNLKGAVPNVNKSIGLYDGYNGFIFQLTGSTPQFIIRSSTSGNVVDNAIDQSNWNIDPMDGTGVSGITLDISKSQIFVMDFEWLGVGSVRMGFIIDGHTYYCHQFNHANDIDFVYLSSPVLPIRCEIQATGLSSPASLDSYCCALISEGGQGTNGRTFSASRGATSTSISNSNVEQVLGIRLKSNYNRLPVFIESLNILVTSNANFAWWLVENPTFTGGSAASWVSVTGAGVEYDISRNGTWNGDGVILGAGFGSNNIELINNKLVTRPYLYSDISGNIRSEICLLALSLNGNNENFYGSITWEEEK